MNTKLSLMTQNSHSDCDVNWQSCRNLKAKC